MRGLGKALAAKATRADEGLIILGKMAEAVRGHVRGMVLNDNASLDRAWGQMLEALAAFDAWERARQPGPPIADPD